MKILFIIGFVTFLLQPALAQEDSSLNDTPYLYYYSNTLKGIVIERTDGTDSRLLGGGLVDEHVHMTHGPGWSPDGQWFAWQVETSGSFYSNIGKGYAVHIDGEQTLDLLEGFSCVYSMRWHPTQNILLIHGVMLREARTCEGGVSYPVTTYWLIDVDNQTILSTFSITTNSNSLTHPHHLNIYWIDDTMVQFAELNRTTVSRKTELQLILVSMYFDGTVNTRPASVEDIEANFQGLTPHKIERYTEENYRFTSWQLDLEARVPDAPIASDFDGVAVASLWDDSNRWVLIGHEFCRAGCGGVTGIVSIFHPETGYNREIADCGGHIACVGWLPNYINLDEMVDGQAISVLPAPVSIEYSETSAFSSHFWDITTHEVVCNPETGLRDSVIDVASGEVAFILPNAERCGDPVIRTPDVIYPTEAIIFALSPDEMTYAITHATHYTSLYLAETGERIATLNFYGEELSFTDDGRYLITKTPTVTATWDIQELLNQYVD